MLLLFAHVLIAHCLLSSRFLQMLLISNQNAKAVYDRLPPDSSFSVHSEFVREETTEAAGQWRHPAAGARGGSD